MKIYFPFLLFICTLFPLTFQAQSLPQLTYITKRDGNFEIYRYDMEGKNHVRLTKNPGWDWSPKWNPALEGIIYYSYDSLKQFHIKLMNIDGRERPLDNHGLEEFILSPDGKKILYTKKVNEHSQIFLYDIKKDRHRNLTNYPSYNGRPVWAADSKKIAFISDRDGNNEVYQLRITNRKITRLTNTPAREKYLSWSPSGKSLALTVQEENEKEEIYLLNIRTKYLTRLTKNNYYDGEIAWSPLGNKIAFKSERNGEDHIYTINIDGSGERQITSAQAYHGEPEWVWQK